MQKIDIYQEEDQNGVRCSWNVFPNNKLDQTKIVVPVGVHYTPYKETEGKILLNYEPLRCNCGGILSPLAFIDYKQKFWQCNICGQGNKFPPTYAKSISETQQPVQIQKPNTTIEYLLKDAKEPQVFIYCIDLCISDKELAAVKDAIQQSLNIIPSDTWVGLVTFGKHCFVHELGFQDCPKSYAINGQQPVTPKQVIQMLGLVNKTQLNKFVLPISQCDFSFNSILDDLQSDEWLPGLYERKQQCAGLSLNVCLSIVEACKFSGSRILTFLGSPCTFGSGTVVGIKQEETMRSYHDIQKENDTIKYMKSSEDYYGQLAQRAVEQKTVIDIYGFCNDQFGLLEMSKMSLSTGGYIVINEQFNSDVFKETYKKIFSRDDQDQLKLATGANMKVFTSRNLKIQGALGCCHSLNVNGPQVSDTVIGQGKTCEWYIGGMDKNTTISFILDVEAKDQSSIQAQYGYVQIQTQYKNSEGQKILRVTTISRSIAHSKNFAQIQSGFDQEASTVLMTRIGILKTKLESAGEILKWLDRSLIRLIQQFSTPDYRNQTVILSKEFDLYPQFMYNLRRSHFISQFGASPDEITFYQATFNRECVSNCIVMIQPALLEYTIKDTEPNPIALDNTALKKDVVLLFDTYFQVLTWNGQQIQHYITQDKLDTEGFEKVKEMVDSPLMDIEMIMEDRFPIPTYHQTYPGHTKERYLLARLNPVEVKQYIQHNESHYDTDDASLKKFMDHLMKIVVQQLSQQ